MTNRASRLTGLPSRFSVCVRPVFLVSLALLLANDFHLKAAYPGWLTGKLSDFAGLIVFSLLLFSLWPKRVRTLAWLVAGTFVWWKSPLSTPAMEVVNGWNWLRIGRVVDYTDLLALATIPLARRVFEARNARLGAAWQKLVFVPSVAAAVFAIAATSVAPYTRVFVIQGIEQEVPVTEADVERVLASIARSGPIECEPSASPARNGETVCRIDGIRLSFSVDRGQASFRIERSLAMGGSRRRIRRVEDLVDDIKRAFSEQREGLEYVEPLVNPRSPLLQVRPVEAP